MFEPTVPKWVYDQKCAEYAALLEKYRTEERFWDSCIPEPNSGCWLWTKSTRPNGYGQFAAKTGHIVYAHRFAFELLWGAIPDGRYVCHRCDTPACINPDHIYLGTPQDNVNDMRERGRAAWGHYLAARTQCANGHAFTQQNTIRRADGSRKCRECGREYMRRKRAS